MSISAGRAPLEPDARTADRDDSSRFDVYALLGVTEDVMPALARGIYWLRVEALREAHERGDADVQHRMEELNAALAILLDEGRRARYDHRYRRSTEATAPSAESGRRLRVGAVLALVLATVVGAVLAALYAGTLALAAVVTAGMLSVIAVFAWPRRAGTARANPFAILRLTPDAGMVEVNLAYETIGQELLSRVNSDRSAIGRLERLDRAHSAALRMIAAREPAEPVERGMLARALRAVTWGVLRATVRLLRLVLGALGALVLAVATWLVRAAARGAGALSPHLRARTAGAVSALRRRPDEQDDVLLDVSIDLSRRLATGPRLRPETAADPGVVPEGEPGPVAAELLAAHESPRAEVKVEAYLVLDAIAGRRRVPIPSAPLSIGSGPDCDLVLPVDRGIAPEHAHVWQRDGTLLIHVLAPRAGACLVNDRPMTWASLDDGDVILLGDARFRVEVR